jgi:hypothetical protein
MGWMVVGMSEGKAAERGFARVTSAVRSMGRRYTSATSRGCGRYDSFHCLNTTPRGVTPTLSLSTPHFAIEYHHQAHPDQSCDSAAASYSLPRHPKMLISAQTVTGTARPMRSRPARPVSASIILFDSSHALLNATSSNMLWFQ